MLGFSECVGVVRRVCNGREEEERRETESRARYVVAITRTAAANRTCSSRGRDEGWEE